MSAGAVIMGITTTRSEQGKIGFSSKPCDSTISAGRMCSCLLSGVVDSDSSLSPNAGSYTLSVTGVPVGHKMLIEITGPASANASFSPPFLPKAGADH